MQSKSFNWPIRMLLLWMTCLLNAMTFATLIEEDVLSHSLTAVNVAILVENARDVYHDDLVQGLTSLNKTLIREEGVYIKAAMDITLGSDPYKALTRACDQMENGAHVLISMTSCESAETLQHMAFRLKVKHLFLSHTSSCQSSQEEYRPRHMRHVIRGGVNERSKLNIPVVTSLEPSADLVFLIVTRLRWDNLIVIHDNTNPTQLTQFLTHLNMTMKRYTINPLPIHICHFATQTLSDKVGNQIVSCIEDIQSQNGHRGNSQKTIELVESQTDTYKNFVVIANTENSLSILKEGKEAEFIGRWYKWVLGNPDISPNIVHRIPNDTNVISILRMHQTDASTASSDGRWHSDTSFKPFQTRLFVRVLQDVILMTVAAVKRRNDNSTLPHITCFSDKLAESAGSSDLFENFSYDKMNSQLSGKIFCSEDKGVVFSPDLRAVRYSLEIQTDAPVDWGQVSERKWSQWEEVAHFVNSEGKWVQKSESLFRDRFSGLKGLMLRIVTIEEEPFIIKTKTPTGVVYSGYCIDILNAIQRHVTSLGTDFQYQLYEVQDNSYGVFDEKKRRWTGLVGDVVSGKADMAVAGMIRNYERESVVDFAASFMDYGVGILVRKPSRTTSAFGFLEPFTVQVWLCISIAAFVVGVSMFILSRLSSLAEDRQAHCNRLHFNFHNSIWFTLASLMQQGCDVTPKTISGRIIGTFWWFFTLIIIATYTANLAAFLTVTRMDSPIEGLSDLATQQKIVYGTVRDSSLEQFFMKQADVDPLYKQIWTQMDSSRPQSMVDSVLDGYRRVIQGNYAFMWDYPVLMYQMKRHCELTTVGKPFNRKNYAFALPKNAIYLESITLSILALEEAGELAKLRQKWFDAESLCPEEDSSSSTPSSDTPNTARGLRMQNVAGVFYILIMGAALSVLTSLLEITWHKCQQLPKIAKTNSGTIFSSGV